jgi:chlorobactene glucosyltransferase
VGKDNRGCVSVIIPARNEEANIETAVRSVAAQQGVCEIIVVDDQSTDHTAEILAALKADLETLRVIRTDPLPPGWMGKTHALAIAVREANGEWLLFTDADTEHRTGSLAALLDRAERERVDLLSISPGQVTVTWWEKAVIPLVYVWLAQRFRFEEVNRPQSPAAAANGQYILIRRQVYERAGGYEAVRAEVLEDVALARRVKASGGRLLFMPGASWVTTRMYRTFRAMWQGWTKNLHLLAERKLGTLLGQAVKLWLFDLIPLVAVLAVGLAAAMAWMDWKWAVALAVAFLLSLLGRGLRYRRAVIKLGFEPGVARVHYRLAGAFLFCLLLLSSAYAWRGSRTVEWKDRIYFIDD